MARVDMPMGLKEKDFKLAYLSLVRYLDVLTKDEIKLLREIPFQQISEIELSEIRVVLNDKFMTQENTYELGRITLNSD